jgi:hypothetical protein
MLLKDIFIQLDFAVFSVGVEQINYNFHLKNLPPGGLSDYSRKVSANKLRQSSFAVIDGKILC